MKNNQEKEKKTMANNCFWQMRCASDSMEALERLKRIMNYEDEEYFMYRVFSADFEIPTEHKDGLFKTNASGDVAWSCTNWFNTEEDFGNRYGNGAHYITLDLLCKRLGIAVELYSEECGFGFQEHYQVTKDGDVVERECVDWSEEWIDDDGNELDEPIETGGFEDYGTFAQVQELWSATA